MYEEERANLYVHHEVQLSAFPLAVEWLPIEPASVEGDAGTRGNYAVVATFLPEIEIWNLDVVNVLEPSVVLGGEVDLDRKKVKQFKKKQVQPVAHSHSTQRNSSPAATLTPSARST